MGSFGRWLQSWRERRRSRAATRLARPRILSRFPHRRACDSSEPSRTVTALVPVADPRLEVYLGQISDLPDPDRAIIMGVLQGILDEEAAYEREVAGP